MRAAIAASSLVQAYGNFVRRLRAALSNYDPTQLPTVGNTDQGKRKPRRRGRTRLAFVERNEAIAVAYREGETMEAIGQRYGLTRERVRQILGPDAAPKRIEARRKKSEEERALRQAARVAKQFKFGPAVQSAVVRRYASGETSGSLAEEFGVSRSAVLNWVRKAGGQVRKRGTWYRGISDDDKLAIACRYAAGETSTTLAEEYGVDVNTVLSYVRRSGGQVRPKGRVRLEIKTA